MNNEEVWKDIYFIKNGEVYDYRGIYQISNYGRIKSFHGKNAKILKQFVNNKGYYMIALHKKNNVKKFTIHSLVAYMFIPNVENKEEIDHIDTDKSNNNADNLRWVTREENLSNEISKMNHSKSMSNREITGEWRKNISNAMNGKNNPRARKVVQYDINGNMIKMWDYVKQVSNELNMSYFMLKETLNGNRKTNEYKGFVWEYCESGDMYE